MARGEGMDTERGQTNCVQRIYVPMAQAIIDEFGLTVETQSLRWMDPNGPFPQERVVGKWESCD